MTLPPRLQKNSGKADKGRRSPGHRQWVRSHQCSVPGCDMRPIECAHLRLGTDGGLGSKPSDAFCWSACRAHHDEQHRLGEKSFQEKYGLDLYSLCRLFFKASPHRSKLEDPFR